MAADNSECSIYSVEDSCHRLIVGDTLRIVAFYDAFECIRSLHGLFLHDFIVLDDTQTNVWSNYREAVNFLISEILVGNLDDSLFADFLGRLVVADSDRSVHLFQLEQVDNLIGLLGWYVVDYGTVFDSRNYELILIVSHNYINH